LSLLVVSLLYVSPAYVLPSVGGAMLLISVVRAK